MKKSVDSIKCFTLIEVLVSVSIFAVVALIVVASLTSGLGVKAKIVALNELRKEGASVMAEMQDMVEKANGSSSSGLTTKPAVAIMSGTDMDFNSPAYTAQPLCNDPAPGNVTGAGFYSLQTDKRNWQVRRAIALRSGSLMEIKQIELFDNGIATYIPSSPTWLPMIKNSNIEVESFQVRGYFRNQESSPQCLNIATKINVRLVLRSKSSNLTGEQSKIILDTTFTPKHPGPDKSEDAT